MIQPVLVRAAILSTLLADEPLTTWLATRSSADEIREANTIVRDFLYPAVRYLVGPQVPQGNGPCYPFNADCTLQIINFSEEDSSYEVETLAWLTHRVFFTKNLHADTFITTRFLSNGLQSPIRTPDRVWRITNVYQFQILPNEAF